MRRAFVSYRREDSSGHVGFLCYLLGKRLGEGRIYRDITSIRAGEDFAKTIREVIPRCGVLLAVIGGRWLPCLRKSDDTATDFVRLELRVALAKSVPVIPVLVGGAQMPSAQDLPEDLRKLATRNAFVLPDRDFAEKADELASEIRPYLKEDWRSNEHIPVEARIAADRFVVNLRRTFRPKHSEPLAVTTVEEVSFEDLPEELQDEWRRRQLGDRGDTAPGE